MKLLIVLTVFAYLAIGMFINGLIDESVSLLFVLFWPLIITIVGPFYILGWLYKLGQKIRRATLKGGLSDDRKREGSLF